MEILGKELLVKVCYDYAASVPAAHIADAEPLFEEFGGWDSLESCVSRETLPVGAFRFVEWVENVIGLRVSCVSKGEKPKDIICLSS